MDEISVARQVSVVKLLELCGKEDPRTFGLLEDNGTLYFGSATEESRLLVSVWVVRLLAETLAQTDYTMQELLFVFAITSLSPVKVAWVVLSRDELTRLEVEEKLPGVALSIQ